MGQGYIFFPANRNTKSESFFKKLNQGKSVGQKFFPVERTVSKSNLETLSASDQIWQAQQWALPCRKVLCYKHLGFTAAILRGQFCYPAWRQTTEM